jgi:hypothetical protein
MKWRLETKKVSELKEWGKNPRIIIEKGLKNLSDSIKKFECAEPLVINTDNAICGGHGRKIILEKMGIDEIECYIPERTLTKKEFEELNLRLNRNIAAPGETLDFSVMNNQSKTSKENDNNNFIPLLKKLPKNKKRLLKDGIDRIRESFNKELEKNLDKQNIFKPKYDSVYEHGVEWLDNLAGNSLPDDPFGGSGTTLIASEMLDRQCRMIEIEPKYCDVIVKRYCKLKNINNNKVFDQGVAG